MEKRQKGAIQLKPDELIERLVPDAAEVPDVRVLVGFLGKSTRQGYWRLYLTPMLNEYVEFAEEAVVHSHTLKSDEGRLGGTAVWIQREANLQHTRSVSREVQADFLKGSIAASASRKRGQAYIAWRNLPVALTWELECPWWTSDPEDCILNLVYTHHSINCLVTVHVCG